MKQFLLCSILAGPFIFISAFASTPSLHTQINPHVKPLASIWTAVHSEYHTGIIVYDLRPVDFTTDGFYPIQITLASGDIANCKLQLDQLPPDIYSQVVHCDSKTREISQIDTFFAPERVTHGIRWFSEKVYIENAHEPDAAERAMVEYR